MAGPHDRRWRFGIGIATFVALMVLTGIEWLGAIYADKPAMIVFPTSVVKALLIVFLFMHIRELWGRDELAEGEDEEVND